MNIPFLDLKAQYKNIKPEIDSAIKKVIDSQSFVLGYQLEAFESEFSKYLGVNYVVGVNSGTDGLILALLCLSIGKGDEVITPANTFIATATAIAYTGATPILVDCDISTYQIDIQQVEKAITKRTKAIIPVHLYGAPAEINKLQKIAKKHKLFLIEDAAQAHGATLSNKKVGTLGDLTAFSFYPGKNLGAYGDGGAVVTNNKNLYEKLLKLRNHGQVKKYYHDSLGINSRLDEIQAAVLRVKLKRLDEWNKKRNKIADYYNKFLKNYKTQEIIKNGKSAYHLFVIECENRGKLQKYLLDKNIHTLIHYPVPIHLQKVYKYLGYKKGDFPNAEKLAEITLSLPIYSEMTTTEVSFVIKTIKAFYNEK